MPSNSRKTFMPALPAGSRKRLRYQATPVERSLMSLRKASSSFHARGSVTSFHAESSKPGASAPAGSPTKSFQPELKLYFARRPAGGSYAKTTDEAHSSAMQLRMKRRFIALINSPYYLCNPRMADVASVEISPISNTRNHPRRRAADS